MANLDYQQTELGKRLQEKADEKKDEHLIKVIMGVNVKGLNRQRSINKILNKIKEHEQDS